MKFYPLTLLFFFGFYADADSHFSAPSSFLSSSSSSYWPSSSSSPSYSSSSSISDPCEISCAGKSPGDKTSDPMNCRKFYVCLENAEYSDTSFPCHDGETFDGTDCALGAPCIDSGCGGNCNFECNTPYEFGEFVRDGHNCSIYSICLPAGDKVEYSCPENKPYFDGLDCGYDPSKCCNVCKPLCRKGQEVANPCDCTKYYVCLSDGDVDPEYSATCPTFMHFDPIEKKCVPGSDCKPICEGPIECPGIGTTSNPTDSTVTKPTDNCLDHLECYTEGLFPKCTNCVPEFFYCKNSTGPAELMLCPGDLLFNPDPKNRYCVTPETCPYH